MKALHQAILESLASRAQGRSTSDFSTDLIGQINSITHGGDVRTDVEVITAIEPDSRDVVERWKLSFEGVYFNKFEVIRDVLPVITYAEGNRQYFKHRWEYRPAQKH